LKRVRWSLNFKPSGIEKYDGSTNPDEWLEVYQLIIKAAGGDLYIMANYLPVYLLSSARTWHLGLPSGSVRSWTHLCRLFTNNFRATSAHPGINWDLATIVQKKGESLWEFMQHFCNKRNAILEVDGKSIIKFFNRGLTNSSLIHKLAMKKPRMSEDMLAITNKLTLVEEVTFDTQERKKEESGHTHQPGSSKGHDEWRKADRAVNTVERP
jgi:hypothetical protein